MEVLCDSEGTAICPAGGVGVYNPGFWGMVSSSCYLFYKINDMNMLLTFLLPLFLFHPDLEDLKVQIWCAWNHEPFGKIMNI